MALPGGDGGSRELRLVLNLQAQDFIGKLLEATAETDDFQEKVLLLKEVIREASNDFGVSFEEVANSVRKLNKEFELFSGSTQKALTQALQQSTEEAKRGFTGATEAAVGFRQQVDELKTQIVSLAGERGISFEDAAVGLKRMGNDSVAVNRALKELNATLKETRQTGEQLTPEEALRRYREQVDQLKIQIQQLAQAQGASFRDSAAALQQAGAPAKELNAALRELNQESQQSEGVLSRLGTVGQFVFGSVLGVTAISVLRRLVGWFTEAARVGEEFARSLFQLEVAVRGLQRVGVDTTLQRFTDNVNQLRQEFRFLTDQELKRASAELALYTREVGFTEEQIFELTRISAALSVVTGRDVGEQGFQIARALASGYTEALQRAGIAISRADITQRAYAEGLDKSFLALTEQERATISLLLLQERTAPVLEDLILFQETWAGQLEVTRASSRALTQQIGQRLIPIGGSLATILNRIIAGFQGVVDIVSFAYVGVISRAAAVTAILRRTLDGSITSLAQFREEFREAVQIATRLAFRDFFEGGPGLGDVDPSEFGIFAQDEENLREQEQLIERLQEAIIEEELRGQQKRFDILVDFQRRVDELIRRFHQKQEELERDHQARLVELGIRFEEQRLKENENFALRVDQTNRQFDIRRQELNEKRRQREIDDERKFQEKLLRLQENFLLELEDAVRERDALQIIRLTRRFNLERRQLLRERDNQKKERDQDFQDQVRDLDRQRAERLRQLNLEHQLRLRQIDRQEQLERAREQRAFEQRMEEERLRLEQRAEELRIDKENELIDLERHIRDRIKLLISGWAEEGKITAENADMIVEVLRSRFGPGGQLEGIVLYAVQLIQLLGQATAQAAATAQAIPDPSGKFAPKTFDDPTGAPKGFQTGGTLIATRPTSAVFGEVPEIVTFTPLTGPIVDRTVGSIPAGMQGRAAGMLGSIYVMLDVSPDLEARVVNKSMDNVADIFFAIQRGRR